jgi:DNA-binding beta-propeller fold protein YncE
VAGNAGGGNFLGAGFLDGPSNLAQFAAPWGVALNASGTILYVADEWNNRIRKIQ